VELTVSGKIPDYAAGTLFRTGPDGYTVETDAGKKWSATHWFDGFSKVHRFQILAPATGSESTRVLYNSRRNVDGSVDRIRKTGKGPEFTFGQKRDLCQTFFQKVMAVFDPISLATAEKANIGVTVSVNSPGLPGLEQSGAKMDAKGSHGTGIQTLWAKTDASMYKQLDPETLEPIGMANQTILHPQLRGSMSAAHAKSDPITGDVFNYNLDIKSKATYRVFRVNAITGKTDILATFQASATYIHSFFLTDNHIVLCAWGMHYALSGLKIVWEKNLLDALQPFDGNHKSRWYVIDRTPAQRGVVATYDSDPFTCFHTINAWEEPSATEPGQIDIVGDLSRYDNLDVLRKFFYENMLSSSAQVGKYAGPKGDAARSRLTRWRLADIPSLDATRLKDQVRTATVDFMAPRSESAELPTINPRHFLRQHRFVYGVTDRGVSSFIDGLVKYDMDDHKPIFWNQHGHSPGEAIFIPSPHGTEEDDGVLLSVVLDGFKERSYLLVLDAKNMKELGRAEVGHAVGFGFHGTHFPADRVGGSFNY
jgi:torulene dioxygenase